MSQTISFHRIVSILDEAYDDWLDIYQQSFPLNEQTLVSGLNRMLRAVAEGGSDVVFLLARDEEGTAAGIALYEVAVDGCSATLWYLAVRPGIRSQGLGTQIYREIVRRTKAASPHMAALVYEVEIPEEATDDATRELARRRIAFYQRNGASLIGGIHYVQSVGWQPPMPMHLMIHPFVAIAAKAAFQCMVAAFGDGVQQVGELTLTP